MNYVTETNPEASLSYEQAHERLLSILDRLQQAALPLADSLKLWQEARDLVEHCENLLARAEQKLREAGLEVEEGPETENS